MKTKRTRHNGMYLAALLLGGLAVAFVTQRWSRSGDGELIAAAPAAGKARPANARLVSDIDIALKNLATAQKAVRDGKKSQAVKSLLRVKDMLTGMRNRAKAVETKAPAGPVVKGWTEDLDLAMKYAARTKRPIVLDFTGSDWCGWCIRLHDEVFSKKAFKDYADKNLVLVTIDFPRSKKLPAEIKQRNSKLSQKYGVRGFPTIVILDSTGKKELGRTGYVRGGPAPFIAGVKKIVGK